MAGPTTTPSPTRRLQPRFRNGPTRAPALLPERALVESVGASRKRGAPTAIEPPGRTKTLSGKDAKLTGSSTFRATDSGDTGFGLVEIVISMLLLALLSIAFLPLLIGALQTSVRNATVATANQLLSEQLDQLQTTARTCSAFDAFEAESVATTTDPRGTQYTPQRVVSACPATFPGSVTVTLRVVVVGQPDVDLETVTFAVVESAS